MSPTLGVASIVGDVLEERRAHDLRSEYEPAKAYSATSNASMADHSVRVFVLVIATLDIRHIPAPSGSFYT